MKQRIKKACAFAILGTLLASSVPIYQGLAMSKNLKVNSRNIILMVGKTKTLSANMSAAIKTSNKKVVSLKSVKKKKCTLVAKKNRQLHDYCKSKESKNNQSESKSYT